MFYNHNVGCKMNNYSRTKNSIYNFTSSVTGQVITVFTQFIVRTVFIHTLGEAYLGIHGLIANILSMMSLAELGVGSAIIFKLYEPLSNKNEHRLTILMKFYRNLYRCIGVIIAIIGLCIIPFLPLIIKDYERIVALHINVTFIFVLYLIDSTLSYLFFAYESALVKADQKEYVINIISCFVTIGTSIIQIICLYLTQNFILYVCIVISRTIIQNILVALYTNVHYSYINSKEKEKLDRTEISSIFKDCGSLFINKFNNIVLKATDNIILSAVLGIDYVALYSNYLILYTTIRSLFTKIFNSVGHSIGNLHTTGDIEHEHNVFESIMLIASILGGTAFVGIAVVADEFIRTWIGIKWVVEQPFSILMGLETYTASIKFALSKYRTTFGLFRQGWIRPIIGIIINLSISIALVNIWGIAGVLVGTIVSEWITFIVYDPIIIYEFGFNKKYSVSKYFIKFFKYIISVTAIYFVDQLVCSRIFIGLGWISVFLHGIICCITVPISLILLSFYTQEGKYIINIIYQYLKRILIK